MCMSELVICVMTDGTATEAELEDVVELVLRTHVAPVTGLEEEVAAILGGTGGREEREGE